MNNWVGTTAFSLAVVASSAQALNLGQIDVQSSLGQPLVARIEILNTLPGEIQGLRARLAAEHVFSGAGVQPTSTVRSLEFSVVEGLDGSSYIAVRTAGPVNDPYLTFFVNVDWAGGEVVREFNLLLNPSVGGQNLSEVSNQSLDLQALDTQPSGQIERSVAVDEFFNSQAQSIENQTVQPIAQSDFFTNAPNPSPERLDGVQPIAVLSQPTPAKPAKKSSKAASVSASKKVRRNDTLWEIAERSRPSGVSQQKTMVAIFNANRSAFIKNNMNMLKAGAILRIPTAAQMKALSQKEAIAAIRSQTKAWRQIRGLEPVVPTIGANAKSTEEALASQSESNAAASSDAVKTGDASVATTIVTPAPQDQLTIVGDDANQKNIAENIATNNDPNSVKSTLDGGVSVLEESIISEELRNAELSGTIQAMQKSIEDLKSLIELRDLELADLQQKLRDQAANSAANLVLNEQATTNTSEVVVAQPAANILPQSEVEAPAISDAVEDNPLYQEDSSWSSGLSNISPLVGGLLLLTGVGLAAAFWMRRRERNDDVSDEFAEDEAMLASLGANDSDQVSEHDDEVVGHARVVNSDQVATWESELTDAQAGDEAQSDSVTADQGDVDRALKEAAVYLEFGLWDRAVEWLKPALVAEPSHSEVALKLLEAYRGSGDNYAFETLADRIRDIHRDDSSVLAEVRRMQDENDDMSGDLTMTMADSSNAMPDPVADQLIEDSGNFNESGLDLSAATVDGVEVAVDGVEQGLDDGFSGSIENGDDDFGLDFDLTELEATLAEFESNDSTGNADSDPSTSAFDNDDSGLDFGLDAAVDDNEMSKPNRDDSGMAGIADIDESETMLDLARAYIEMGDRESARTALNELVDGGSNTIQERAKDLLRSIN